MNQDHPLQELPAPACNVLKRSLARLLLPPGHAAVCLLLLFQQLALLYGLLRRGLHKVLADVLIVLPFPDTAVWVYGVRVVGMLYVLYII